MKLRKLPIHIITNKILQLSVSTNMRSDLDLNDESKTAVREKLAEIRAKIFSGNTPSQTIYQKRSCLTSITNQIQNNDKQSKLSNNKPDKYYQQLEKRHVYQSNWKQKENSISSEKESIIHPRIQKLDDLSDKIKNYLKQPCCEGSDANNKLKLPTNNLDCQRYPSNELNKNFISQRRSISIDFEAINKKQAQQINHRNNEKHTYQDYTLKQSKQFSTKKSYIQYNKNSKNLEDILQQMRNNRSKQLEQFSKQLRSQNVKRQQVSYQRKEYNNPQVNKNQNKESFNTEINKSHQAIEFTPISHKQQRIYRSKIYTNSTTLQNQNNTVKSCNNKLDSQQKQKKESNNHVKKFNFRDLEKQPAVSRIQNQQNTDRTSIAEYSQQIQLRPKQRKIYEQTQKKDVQVTKLAKKLANQITLDQKMKKHRINFFNNKQQNKWNLLKNQLHNRRVYYEIDQLKQQLKVASDEHNPFDQMTDIDVPLEDFVYEMAKSYTQAEKHWKEQVWKCLKFKTLQEQGFTIKNIDLNKKGYLSIEDIVCFINLYSTNFFRNRDAVLICRRLMKKQKENLNGKLSYEGFLSFIVSD